MLVMKKPQTSVIQEQQCACKMKSKCFSNDHVLTNHGSCFMLNTSCDDLTHIPLPVSLTISYKIVKEFLSDFPGLYWAPVRPLQTDRE